MFPKNLLSRSVPLFAIALMIAASAPAFSDTIAVIGTGRVGGALGPQFAALAKLAEGMGFEAIDVGPVQHARHIEGMLIIWINNRYVAGEPFEFHLRKVER